MVQQISKSEKEKLKKSIWYKFAKSAEEHQNNISKAKNLPSQILCALNTGETTYNILLMLGELYWRMSDDKVWFDVFKEHIDNRCLNDRIS